MMKYNFKILYSKCTNPYYNLALEEYLISKKLPILFLWQNEPTVVIGRNQNPYKECNISKITNDKVHIVRRRSGGGAVYHDFGNLNFTIISKKYDNCIESNFDFVKNVLLELGINAKTNGRNDLEIDNKKISGSAFFEEDNIFCHHGTLLINVDTSKLNEYLTPSKLKLKSKGIESVQSRIVNLKSIYTNITVNKVIDKFCEMCNTKPNIITKEDIEKSKEICSIIDKYRSWQWNFGETIQYNVKFEKKFKWGLIETEMLINDGYIQNIKLFTDCLINEDFSKLSNNLIGVKFSYIEIHKIVNDIIKDNEIKKDICTLFDLPN